MLHHRIPTGAPTCHAWTRAHTPGVGNASVGVLPRIGLDRAQAVAAAPPGRLGQVTGLFLRHAHNVRHLCVAPDVPHFSMSVWPPTSGGLGLVVDAGGDVEQVQDLLLQVAELGLVGLDDVVVCVDELVACEVVEDFQDPWRTRCGAVA